MCVRGTATSPPPRSTLRRAAERGRAGGAPAGAAEAAGAEAGRGLRRRLTGRPAAGSGGERGCPRGCVESYSCCLCTCPAAELERPPVPVLLAHAGSHVRGGCGGEGGVQTDRTPGERPGGVGGKDGTSRDFLPVPGGGLGAERVPTPNSWKKREALARRPPWGTGLVAVAGGGVVAARRLSPPPGNGGFRGAAGVGQRVCRALPSPASK